MYKYTQFEIVRRISVKKHFKTNFNRAINNGQKGELREGELR